ncbi:MAG: hypothetical protein F6K55_01805 [Moorea sp. SIO4A3]|nr:hypothetical protein [Moorena sp. SIO4A3]
MSKPDSSLTQAKQELIKQYSSCQLGMTPREFYSKWPVTHSMMAMICSRSVATVGRWFSRGSNYLRPQRVVCDVLQWLRGLTAQNPESLRFVRPNVPMVSVRNFSISTICGTFKPKASVILSINLKNYSRSISGLTRLGLSVIIIMILSGFSRDWKG